MSGIFRSEISAVRVAMKSGEKLQERADANDDFSIRGALFGIAPGNPDNLSAILAAYAEAAGRYIILPAGVIETSAISGTLPGFKLKGPGKNVCTLKLKAAQNTHLLEAANGATDWAIEDLTIDGNRANQASGHVMRLAGITGLQMRNFKIQNARGYGIGGQDGANQKINISDFEIDTTGNDAIDFKDRLFLNDEIAIERGVIRNFGIDSGNQAAIDIRGPVNVHRVKAYLQNPTNRGVVRLRAADVQGRAGTGLFSKLWAVCTNGDGMAMLTENGTKDFVFNGVKCEGGALGVISGDGGIFNGLTQVNGEGQDALSIFGTNCKFTNVSINGCARGVDFENGATGNTLSYFQIQNASSNDAIRCNPSANNNQISEGSIPVGKTIADSAIGTKIRNVANWKTESNVLSSTFGVDATGSKIVTIPHGLNVTPEAADVQLTARIPLGGVSDWRYTLLQQEGNPDTTNIYARIVVTTASATQGAVAQLCAMVRAKHA